MHFKKIVAISMAFGLILSSSVLGANTNKQSNDMKTNANIVDVQKKKSGIFGMIGVTATIYSAYKIARDVAVRKEYQQRLYTLIKDRLEVDFNHPCLFNKFPIVADRKDAYRRCNAMMMYLQSCSKQGNPEQLLSKIKAGIINFGVWMAFYTKFTFDFSEEVRPVVIGNVQYSVNKAHWMIREYDGENTYYHNPVDGNCYTVKSGFTAAVEEFFIEAVDNIF